MPRPKLGRGFKKMNERRIDLIMLNRPLTAEETKELEALQEEVDKRMSAAFPHPMPILTPEVEEMLKKYGKENETII